MHRDPRAMIAHWSDPDTAPRHAISLSRRDFDRLVEAAGVLAGRDQSALNAQPDSEFFRERWESSRALLAALHKSHWGTRITRSPQ